MTRELWQPCGLCGGKGWEVTTPPPGELPQAYWCERCHHTGKVPNWDGEMILRFLAEMEGRK